MDLMIWRLLIVVLCFNGVDSATGQVRVLNHKHGNGPGAQGLGLGLGALGGDATVTDQGPNAFGFPVPTLERRAFRAFAVGNALFKENWVSAPASSAGRDGLGPLFNAPSCSSCHARDGRSKPPANERDDHTGLLLRIGLVNPESGPDLPHSILGGQVQDRCIQGLEPEAEIRTHYELIKGHFPDGTPYELRRPIHSVQWQGRDLASDSKTVVGGRVAPQLIGLGLLQAVPVANLLKLADPNDQDADGISGRIHWQTDAKVPSQKLPGRFGWKATQTTIRNQVAAAFLHDIGITSPLHPTEALTPSQRQRIKAPSGGDPELSAHKLDRVTFYCQVLAVPSQRTPQDPDILRGGSLFEAIGCTSCHTPTLTTSDSAAPKPLRNQRIHPFTDLLLHDMGPALADQKHDGHSTPQEWRTPPLWGLGLVPVVNGHTTLLHDGRARNFTEAILWHGGEAKASNERFQALSAKDRASLLAFLRSL